ncbi:sigma-70 family RNA polymerase sigma factor [Neorhodopirellula pilleata]|uniref:ECF RNA polymerase sigma factor SigW n=1 Tax=Neorhodopirellula pilleata TaxID=2714738 RepID=A0A5C6ATS7_9BACT|nr:sigma-70 family RNA polymerase sigma factor [Neorhodopirellula pilleata]TWU03140.1 ECF RNA polymerase sigma factor SigW [Neorhodopirellula pilleata]
MLPSKSERLVELLSQHHDSLYRYIFSLVGNAHDARDVLQETSFALYEKWDQFDSSRPFLPWAYKFAYIHVLKWRAARAKHCPTLDADVIELLAVERQQEESQLAARLDVLENCLSQLPDKDRELVQDRYFRGITPDELVDHRRTSRRTLFRELQRVRHLLMACIERKLQQDPEPA